MSQWVSEWFIVSDLEKAIASPSFASLFWPKTRFDQLLYCWGGLLNYFFEQLSSWIRIRQVEPQRGQKLYALRKKDGRWHLCLLLFLLNSNQCEVYASTHPACGYCPVAKTWPKFRHWKKFRDQKGASINSFNTLIKSIYMSTWYGL